MESITLSKTKFNRLIEMQENMKIEIDNLKNIILDSLDDELDPLVIKKLEKMSKILDTGDGLRFNSREALKSYLSQL